jgi:hypothetical protein
MMLGGVMKTIAEYLDTAVRFHQMAEDAKGNPEVQATLKKQAEAYRKLALDRVKRLGKPRSEAQ